MITSHPRSLVRELDALGPAVLRRAASDAASMFAADVSGAAPGMIDPLPVVISAPEWEELTAGLVQRARLLDALHADLYGPRMVFSTDVAPIAELLADPAYLRAAVGIPSRGPRRLFALSCTVQQSADGHWRLLEDIVDVPRGAGLALEMRRVLSRSIPDLYGSTELRRLHPFFDRARAALDHRGRGEGRAGRTVVLMTEEEDPLQAFDHHWFANLLGSPVVSASDLRTGSGQLTLRLPGVQDAPADTVDTVIRLVPSGQVDPLDLGPTALQGITGLVEAARCGDVEIVNPLGAGLLENPAVHSAMPDLCRQILHEDLLLRSPTAGPEADGQSAGENSASGTTAGWATVPSLDPAGDEQLLARPVTLQLLIVAGQDEYEVLPGGVATTADALPPAVKDVWVLVPEGSGVGSAHQSPVRADLGLPSHPTMTSSIGSDLFWFGRYLERVDLTARLLRTVVDTANDLSSERSPAAHAAVRVLLRAVTDVTATFPGFHQMDLQDPDAVRTEITSLLTRASRPGSLAQSFDSLTRTTRTLRDLVSDDVWPTIARMRSRIRGLAAVNRQPLEPALTDIIDGCLTLSGAVSDSMPRNLGWDLTETGRRIERALGLLTLLRASLGHSRTDTAEARITLALAAITESSASYRRHYHAAARPELLLELLLSDATLPRSIAFQLLRLGQSVERLPESTPAPELRAPLSLLRGRVTAWTPRELLGPSTGGEADTGIALHREADAAIAALRDLAVAIEDVYFRPAESTSPWGFDDV